MDIEILSGCLFGFPECFGVRAKSQTNDYDFPPRVVPLKMAELIKEIDPSSTHFHVIPNPPYAEVWLKREWLTSVSFRNTQRPDVIEHFRQRSRDITLQESIKRRLALTDPSLLATFVEAVKTNSLNEQMIQAFKLQDIIAEYHK